MAKNGPVYSKVKAGSIAAGGITAITSFVLVSVFHNHLDSSAAEGLAAFVAAAISAGVSGGVAWATKELGHPDLAGTIDTAIGLQVVAPPAPDIPTEDLQVATPK